MHKKQLYAMTLHELLDKPVWQMTGEELLFLAQHGKMHDEGEVTIKSNTRRGRGHSKIFRQRTKTFCLWTCWTRSPLRLQFAYG